MDMTEIAGLLVDRAIELLEDKGISLIPFEEDHLYDGFLATLDYLHQGLEDETLTGEDPDGY